MSFFSFMQYSFFFFLILIWTIISIYGNKSWWTKFLRLLKRTSTFLSVHPEYWKLESTGKYWNPYNVSYSTNFRPRSLILSLSTDLTGTMTLSLKKLSGNYISKLFASIFITYLLSNHSCSFVQAQVSCRQNRISLEM